MLELVTLPEAREHLRLDYDDAGGPDDPWLEVMIPAISETVALWLKSPARLYVPETDEAGNAVRDDAGEPVPALGDDDKPTVRPVVRAAVLMELESAYRFRGGESKDNMVPAHEGYGYMLNKASTALLQALRKPTAA